ncbi:uroporphyrinogen decarboxylase [Corynebacterium aquilae]|uniref:Uroporphyrinogen decarboxylase n=1 Tax=Corynebacterium aquilae DSM 44791 TaxID=1431546 RepID=A0A1L7CDK8_9CORY|nr:uroporphyrinogen decarboxylase [Corynebacterium aquilae]APT83950.1 uroporphyrinogen decarboxylase [Corynebacterium aquilae DSM 44791]
MSTRRHIPDAPFLVAARGEKPRHTPVWFMRQAGRSLPEYRRVREGIAMLDSCFDAELLAEITLQPVRRHGVDAAILFSDIVVPLKAAGVDVEIVAGTGPVIAQPVRSRADVDNLPQLEEDITALSRGIELIVDELDDQTALIGFAGAPFTLASYLVEGGPSRNHERTKALMHSDPETWHALMQRLTPTVIAFLRQQVDAGVDAIQLFDSWAGYLAPHDYERHVLPYSAEILSAITEVPRSHFGVCTGELLPLMAKAGPDILGVDWRTPLDAAAARLDEPLVLQGNLDPALLFAGQDAVDADIARIVAEARRAIDNGTARGHIFNLGHGVLPTTDPDAITRAVATVHSM